MWEQKKLSVFQAISEVLPHCSLLQRELVRICTSTQAFGKSDSKQATVASSFLLLDIDVANCQLVFLTLCHSCNLLL